MTDKTKKKLVWVGIGVVVVGTGLIVTGGGDVETAKRIIDATVSFIRNLVG